MRNYKAEINLLLLENFDKIMLEYNNRITKLNFFSK